MRYLKERLQWYMRMQQVYMEEPTEPYDKHKSAAYTDLCRAFKDFKSSQCAETLHVDLRLEQDMQRGT